MKTIPLPVYSIEEDGLPKKDGSYLVLCETAAERKSYLDKAWWNAEHQRWDIYPLIWREYITHYIPMRKLVESIE